MVVTGHDGKRYRSEGSCETSTGEMLVNFVRGTHPFLQLHVWLRQFFSISNGIETWSRPKNHLENPQIVLGFHSDSQLMD
jgi:hypothetical protein